MHTAHPYAQPAWLEDAFDHVGDVVRHVLLRLQSSHVHLHDARDLRCPDDHPLGNVADDEMSEERQDVMRAKRFVSAADDNEVLTALIRR